MRKLCILGAGGHAKVVADAAWQSRAWDEVEFFDDHPNARVPTTLGRVVGSIDAFFARCPGLSFVVALGHNERRLEFQQRATRAGALPVSIIHPRACVAGTATAGAGSVVFAGAVINPCASIGNAVIVNTNVTIKHECVLEDGVHLSPAAALAGAVRIGRLTWIGLGACVIEGVSIVARSIVGAGSTVIRDIDIPGTYVGVPVKRVEKSQ